MKNKSDATEFAQRLINEVRKAGESNLYWTTVSVGAAEVTSGMSIDEALENADKSLYVVKKQNEAVSLLYNTNICLIS